MVGTGLWEPQEQCMITSSDQKYLQSGFRFFTAFDDFAKMIELYLGYVSLLKLLLDVCLYREE